jgi:hypothetical protein
LEENKSPEGFAGEKPSKFGLDEYSVQNEKLN